MTDERLARVRENLASPFAKQYPDAVQRYGAKNVEVALIAISRMTDPIKGLAIVLDTDDEGVLAVLDGAFAASKRMDLNSDTWIEKLADAIETVRWSFKQPIILLPNGAMRVVEPNGDVSFEGTDWDFVRWVREKETTVLTPEELEVELLTPMQTSAIAG